LFFSGSVPEQQLQGLRLKVALTRKDKFAAEAHLKHPEMLTHICRFYDMVARLHRFDLIDMIWESE
jgi:hypothetical protein